MEIGNKYFSRRIMFLSILEIVPKKHSRLLNGIGLKRTFVPVVERRCRWSRRYGLGDKDAPVFID